jgi:cell division transport system permease protein
MRIWQAIARGLRGARKNPLVQMVAVGTIALSLVLVGTVELVAANVANLARGWAGDVRMTVYLEDGCKPERAQKIAGALSRLPGVTEVRMVAPHEAYERLRRSLGSHADLLDGVEDGFLPASLEVALKPGVVDVIRAHPAFERLRHAPGVEDVELVGDWIERLRALESLLHELGLAVGVLVLAACLYIVGSTIRLGVFASRDEIEILKLVGATDGFVKAPFLVEGLVQGVCGTVLACGLLYGLYRLARPHVEASLGALLAAGPLTFFRPTELAVAVGFGALLGLAGSSLAVRRYVKG